MEQIERLDLEITFWEGLLDDFTSISYLLFRRGNKEEAELHMQCGRFSSWIIEYINEAERKKADLLHTPRGYDRELTVPKRTVFPIPSNELEGLQAKRDRLLAVEKAFGAMKAKLAAVKEMDVAHLIHIASVMGRIAGRNAEQTDEQIKGLTKQSNN